jgi:transposase InsO family protein
MALRVAAVPPTQPRERRSMDFMLDWLIHCTRMRVLTVADRRAGTRREAHGYLQVVQVDNYFIESFNALLPDERFNANVFASLADARRKIEAWRINYKEIRPHSSLGDQSPSELTQASEMPNPPPAATNLK